VEASWQRYPLGVLADVQVYVVNADPGSRARGTHRSAPHTRERGVVADDDLLTVAALLSGKDFDRTPVCAVRRQPPCQAPSTEKVAWPSPGACLSVETIHLLPGRSHRLARHSRSERSQGQPKTISPRTR
jgi:hypothetical protein